MNTSQHTLFGTLQNFDLGNGRPGKFYSLPALEKAGVGPVSRLPVSIRLVLESVLRNCDGKRVTEQNVRALANWKPNADAHGGNPVRGRAHRVAGLHRRAVAGGPGGDALGRGAAGQESEDHRAAGAGGSGGGPLGAGGLATARRTRLRRNLEMEFQRNRERYQFLKWGMQAFDTFKVVPPGHRHRPPGQPGIPRQGRAVVPIDHQRVNPQRSIIPTRWSAPIRTRR